MTNHEAKQIIKDRKECFQREIQRRYGMSDCDMNCRKCDLLHPTEDVNEAFDLAMAGLDTPIWINATDDPIIVAQKLIYGLYVDEYDDENAVECFSKKQLREIAKHLLVYCEEGI